jgi:hypothetical protein
MKKVLRKTTRDLLGALGIATAMMPFFIAMHIVW